MAPGGGFIMGTACLDWRTPEENIRAFIKASKKYGKMRTLKATLLVYEKKKANEE